ncbi:MAG TPA: hypothetical protein PLG59_01300 [bacterium]|nr:hypothetical protein [bacterium]HQO33266.1 hypothetical protein [bacterium]HQP99783.1 hypothetical protein [bacterium]
MQNVMTYEQMRDEYLQHVADLYRTVTDWTQSLDPNAELERQQITIR